MNKKQIKIKKRSAIFAYITILILSLSIIAGCENQESGSVSSPNISGNESPSVNEIEECEPSDVPEESEENTSLTEDVENETEAETEEDASDTEEVENSEETTTEDEDQEAEEITPAPTEEPEPTEPPHTHNYNSSVTNATCTTDGYTTYTCNCGDSYTTTIPATGHSYVNGDCYCGAHDPNYVPPHTHSWTEHTWTEDVVDGYVVEVFVCDCNIEWSSMADLNAHQASEPLCTGWSNKGKWIETITQIIHHYRECACGVREDID